MKKIPVSVDALKGVLDAVPRRALIVSAVVLVVAIGGLIAVDRLLGGRSEQTQDAWAEAYQQMAAGTAQVVATALVPYTATLDELVSNTAIQQALEEGDPVVLEQLASQSTPDLAGVLRLRLLPGNVRDPDLEAAPPLTFASISMLRKSRENGRNPTAEVHLAGSEQEHIVMIRRVVSPASEVEAESLLGFLHLSVNPNVVREAFLQDQVPQVYAELRQLPKVQIAVAGDKPDAGAPSTSAPVKGTKLQVRFTAPGAVASAAGGSNLTLAIIAVVAVVIAGLVVLSRRGVATPTVRRAATDTVIYQGAIRAILDGAHPGLEQLLPGMRQERTDFDIAMLDEADNGPDATVFKPSATLDDDPTVPRDEPDEPTTEPRADAPEVPGSIFRSYDIRGIVGETLTEDGVYQIGRALGAEADARGQKTVVVARDGRHSSESLRDALTKGLLESGRDVLDIGMTPTPVLYFATHHLDARSGVMITGSHNPAEYNGLKIVLDGETLSGEAIQAIRRRVEEQDFVDGTGSMEVTDIVAEYIRRISEEIPVTLGNALKVVVDCGNGVPGIVAPDILRAIGHDVIELYCDVDGDFPNHHPDPSQPDNLEDLINAVQDEGADLGFAFDGDGDRLGVVDNEGNIIWPDRQMILFARDILSRNQGAKIIFDVKCSRLLPSAITEAGGEPVMSQTGHSLIKSKMQENGALLAGEMSGHIFFKERWYGFDDALYSAARMLEILVNSGKPPTEVFGELPSSVSTPELRLDMPEERHAEFMDTVINNADFGDAEISTIDGLRVDFPDSWGLIRASNTTPCLVLRFEGDDEAALESIKARFRDLLGQIDGSLSLPF